MPGVDWTPDHPDWEVGCGDAVMAENETNTTARVLRSFFPDDARRCHTGLYLKVLDCGAGSGQVGQRIFNRHNLQQCDINPIPNRDIRAADVTKLVRYGCGEFDIVHIRRVLTNVAVEDRPAALSELHRVLKDGGLLIVVDCFAAQYKLINECRRAAKLPDLQPDMGKARLHQHTLLDDFQLLHEEAIGADYYVSSRLIWPSILGNFAPEPLRSVSFRVNNADSLCPHRIMVLEKE